MLRDEAHGSNGFDRGLSVLGEGRVAAGAGAGAIAEELVVDDIEYGRFFLNWKDLLGGNCNM